jgi:Flp pilus assembly protein TadD
MRGNRLKFAALCIGAAALAGCAGPGALEASANAGATAQTTPAPLAPDLADARTAFRARDFGLAEQRFHAVVSGAPDSAEAWLGLAASYDELRRFDLADESYRQVERLSGDSVALRNNRGYSYFLRGRYRDARRDFSAAQRREPGNPFVAANLRLLEQRGRGARF